MGPTVSVGKWSTGLVNAPNMNYFFPKYTFFNSAALFGPSF